MITNQRVVSSLDFAHLKSMKECGVYDFSFSMEAAV